MLWMDFTVSVERRLDTAVCTVLQEVSIWFVQRKVIAFCQQVRRNFGLQNASEVFKRAAPSIVVHKTFRRIIVEHSLHAKQRCRRILATSHKTSYDRIIIVSVIYSTISSTVISTHNSSINSYIYILYPQRDIFISSQFHFFDWSYRQNMMMQNRPKRRKFSRRVRKRAEGDY